MTPSIVLTLVILFNIALASELELTEKNFDSVINGDTAAFIKFYAPWCGHCRNMANDWKQLGDEFDESTVKIASVDADKHRELGTRFHVKGFPTIKWFPKGETENPEDYNGARSLEQLSNFVTEKLGNGDTEEGDTVPSKPKKKLTPKPSVDKVVHVESLKAMDDLIHSGKHVMVEFYSTTCGHCQRLKPTYAAVAEAFSTEPNVIIADVNASDQEELSNKYEIQALPTIFYFAPNEPDSPETYEVGRSEKNFVDYINERAGTHRVVGGAYSAMYGRFEDLDAYVRRYLTAAKSKQAEIIKETKKRADSLDLPFASYYHKYMSKASASAEYIKKETTRLGAMIKEGVANHSIDKSKLDTLMIRQNILAAFSPDDDKENEDGAVKTYIEYVKKGATDTQKVVKDSAKKFKESATEAASTVASKSGKVADKVADAGKAGVKKAQQTAGKVVDSVKEEL